MFVRIRQSMVRAATLNPFPVARVRVRLICSASVVIDGASTAKMTPTTRSLQLASDHVTVENTHAQLLAHVARPTLRPVRLPAIVCVCICAVLHTTILSVSGRHWRHRVFHLSSSLALISTLPFRRSIACGQPAGVLFAN